MQAVEEPEQSSVPAILAEPAEAVAVVVTTEPAAAVIIGDEDPYIVKNAMTIYSWARFQEGSIKLSDIKEVYMV